jgi:hypothetical protein
VVCDGTPDPGQPVRAASIGDRAVAPSDQHLAEHEPAVSGGWGSRTMQRLIRKLVPLAAASLFTVVAAGCAAPAPSAPPGDCAAALAYLDAHAAPGFASYCPHYADGNAGETVVPPQQVDNPGSVTGVIYISDTNCAVAYENEAANSHGHLVPDANGDGSFQWVWPVPFDPYGPCTS